MNTQKEFNAVVTLAYRDVLKYFRDRSRIIGGVVFPVIFIGVLAGSLDANVGKQLGYNLYLFAFLGSIANTMFNSTAQGIISLTEDREADFAQEVFVSPVSRYSILLGKILGESAVSFLQVLSVVAFAIIIQIPVDYLRLVSLIPLLFVVSFLGGAFGILMISILGGGRGAREIFPFIIFPQFFLAGVFTPIKQLPFPIDILSLAAPLRYGVDVVRGFYYLGTDKYDKIVLLNPALNLTIIAVVGLIFMVVGTYRFVNNEKNR